MTLNMERRSRLKTYLSIKNQLLSFSMTQSGVEESMKNAIARSNISVDWSVLWMGGEGSLFKTCSVQAEGSVD